MCNLTRRVTGQWTLVTETNHVHVKWIHQSDKNYLPRILKKKNATVGVPHLYLLVVFKTSVLLFIKL